MHANDVEVSDLEVRYGSTTAVDGITFTIPRGGCLALLGPNGAGKTTTVECVEGYRRPHSGTVRVLGRDPIAERAQVMPHLGVMLQDGGGYPSATPRELLRLFGRFYATPREPEDLLALVGLDGRPARARVRTLSGGERQRLSLALALIGRPRLLCLDEPTAGMDPVVRRATWELVAGLRAEGTTVLLTSHDLDEVTTLADRVGILHRGRLEVLDTVAALSGRAGLAVTYAGSAPDHQALTEALRLTVRSTGDGRLVLDADRDAVPAVAAWFADQAITLTGVAEVGAGLEATYLEIVGAAAARDR